jgi:hypothetical protein
MAFMDENTTDDGIIGNAPPEEPEDQAGAPDGDGGITGNPPGGKEGNPPAEQAGAAPAQYEPISLPEGVTLDEQMTGEITALGQKVGLTQTQLQAVVEFGVSKGVFGGLDLDELRLKVRESDKAELAKRGLSADIRYAQRVFNRFGDQEVADVLKQSGLTHNPALTKFLIGIGKELGEAPFAKGGNPSPGSDQSLKSIAQKIYAGAQ